MRLYGLAVMVAAGTHGKGAMDQIVPEEGFCSSVCAYSKQHTKMLSTVIFATLHTVKPFVLNFSHGLLRMAFFISICKYLYSFQYTTMKII